MLNFTYYFPNIAELIGWPLLGIAASAAGYKAIEDKYIVSILFGPEYLKRERMQEKDKGLSGYLFYFSWRLCSLVLSSASSRYVINDMIY